MVSPRVTVICLCYNQARFVKEAIQSVMDQTYPNIQLLVVDDASTDDSVTMIRQSVENFPEIRFFTLSENSGNCKAFNHALAHAEGEFVIDLAADDVLLPERISEGVKLLDRLGGNFGVHFTDAYLISENGTVLGRHSDRHPHTTIPQGNIYKDLIRRYFICSPSMMFRRQVIVGMGGYDETLGYEDFDFWIRSSRNYLYCYTPSALVKKRLVKNSMSQRQFSILNPQLNSTYRVCEKILKLNRTADEQKALAGRIRYEARFCLRRFHFRLIFRYVGLYGRNAGLKYKN